MAASRVALEAEFGQDVPAELPTSGAPVAGFDCDMCGVFFEGEPGGAGLLMWTRGEEVRYEEPPLCEECAVQVTLGALLRWEIEDEEEG
jgi:hypothetical protein